MAIISWLPDYVVFILIGLIVFIIYYLLPEEIKVPVKKFVGNYGFYIVLLLAWLYLRTVMGLVSESPDSFPANLNRATFFILLALLLYQLVSYFLFEQRYFTTHFVCNNLSGSCARRQDVGDWTIFYLGTSGTSDEKIIVPWPIPQRIVVVPKCAWDFLGNQMVAQSLVSKTDILQLPEDVAHFIETDTFGKMRKEEIYMGYWSEKLRTEDPRVDDYESNYKKLNSRINELAKMLEGKLTHVKTFVADTLGTVDRMKGKSWLNRGGGNQPMEE